MSKTKIDECFERASNRCNKIADKKGYIFLDEIIKIIHEEMGYDSTEMNTIGYVKRFDDFLSITTY